VRGGPQPQKRPLFILGEACTQFGAVVPRVTAAAFGVQFQGIDEVDVVDNDITKIMNDIWGTFLQLSLDASTFEGAWENTCSTFGSKIDIRGEHAWSVTLLCGQDAAKLAASAMFCKAGDELSADDIQETIAELANMLGGNIKTLLPGRNQLSLPSPLSPEAEAYALAHCLMTRLAFLCKGSPIEVRLYRQEAA
jgi:chemotaxis protein CheX